MDGLRPYSTIGIEGFIDGPTHPLPSSYLSRSSSSSSSSSPPFISWEITGVVKDKPEDFVVREILPKNNIKISKIVSHYNSTRNTNDKNGGDVAVNENNNNNNNNNDDAFLIASIPTVPPIVLPSDCQESKASPFKSETAIDQDGKEPPKEKLSGEQQQQIPSLTTTTTTISTTSCINSNPSSFSSSGENPTASSTTTSSSEPLTEEEIIQIYLEHVATLEHPATVLRQSLEELEARVTNRIPLSHDNIVGTSSNSEVVADDSIHNIEVWIPPFRLLKEDNDNLGLKFRTNRRDFHRAISIKFPFLKTVSSIRHIPPMTTTTTKNNSTSITKDTTDSTNTNDRVTSANTNTNTNDEHWIKVTVEDCFDGMIEHLNAPRDDLRRLLLFRNRGFDGASTISSTLLRLRSDVSKDDRRTVHHIISLKNRNFESSMRNQGSSKQDDSSLKSIVVTWKRQALTKDARKNNKRKHSRNDGGGRDSSKHRNNDKNLLCVLKKTQKEHLTAMQILSRILKCRQSDIGFAGIKDMQAITYQFITLRDMEQQHVERIINQLGKQNVELKIIYLNVDFALNVGDLKGNFFEIMVRNLKRIKVDQHSHPDGETDASESLEESFVECDSVHINQMVGRIKKHGFINFYGEQRIGHPGSSVQVGVRGFQIGQAMLRKDYMGAIKLLMEGTRHRENDDVRRVRQAWKESNGDPSTTIKAFGNADIMPRERAVLRGLKRYPNNPLESLRFLSHQMRMFYINAYQSYIFNQVASQRIKLYGDTVIKGDIYFDTDGDHCRDSIKIVNCNEVPPIEITQVVLPLPGYDVQYPGNDIGQLYKDLLLTDNIRFEKNSVPESTAKGSYRKLIVHPGKLSADIVSSNSCSTSMKLSFELPKGCYATMLLRELMVTTVIRSNC